MLRAIYQGLEVAIVDFVWDGNHDETRAVVVTQKGEILVVPLLYMEIVGGDSSSVKTVLDLGKKVRREML